MKRVLTAGAIVALLCSVQAWAQITVSKPAGGETWVRNVSHTIQWSTGNYSPSTVALRLVNPTDTATVLTIADNAPNTGSYVWPSIPASVPAGPYKVKVVVMNQWSGLSGQFTVADPPPAQLKVTSPNGGESWQAGASKPITWTPGGATGNVRIELYRNGTAPGNKVGVIATGVSASAGTYPWTVGSYQGGTAPAEGGYRVMVIATTPPLQDASDNTFSIAAAPPAALKVTSPNGGESWTANTSKPITWTPGGATGNVRIELYRNGTAPGNKVGVIATGVSASAGTYPWTVGTYQGGTAPAEVGYTVMVIATTPPLQDASDATFSIAAQGQAGGFHPQPGQVAAAAPALAAGAGQVVVPVAPIRILDPTHDSQWMIGNPGTVRWEAKDDVKYPLWLFLVSADHTRPIMDMGKVGSANSRPTQASWTVTNNISPGQYCVRITSADTKAEVHSQPFSIAFQTEDIVFTADYKNWMNCIPTSPYAQPPASACNSYTVVPPGSIGSHHALVGYDYHSFVWPDTGTTGWLTSCYRSRPYFLIDNYKPRSAKLVSATLHFKQTAVRRVNDTHASCATGYFILTALWTDWYNPSITVPTPTSALSFGSTDYTVDVTSTVKTWLDGTRVNYGFLLVSQEIDSGKQPKACGSVFDVTLTLKFRKH